jgi:large subunit ribosomal protein L10e
MGLASRVSPGQVILEAHVKASNLELAKRGFKVASSKLGCPTQTRVVPLREPTITEEE